MEALKAVLMMGACIALVLQCAQATSYTVGGSSNWTIPAVAGNAQLYTNWVSGKTFKVGDELVFNFVNGQHDVLEVTKTNYDNCVLTSPLSTHTTPPVKITLNTTGAHYYVCSIGTHCQSGQKLEVTVAASTPSSSPSPSPSPSSSTTSPPPSTTSSPPPSSESPSASIPPAASPPPSTPTTPSSSGSNGPAATPPSTDNNSASHLKTSLGVLSGVAALFLL